MSVFDVLLEPFAEFALNFGVALGALVIDVDFPTDATGVGAFAGNAMERIVEFWNTEKHDAKIDNGDLQSLGFSPTTLFYKNKCSKEHLKC